MNTTSLPWFQRCKIYMDIMWSMMSLLCVPGLIGIAIYWTASPGSSAYVVTKSAVYASIAPGEVTSIKSDIHLAITSPRIIYKMRLVDSMGITKYVYPDVETTETPELGNIMLRIPAQVPAGEYKLFVDINYLQNPIKTNTLKVQLASLVISAKSK